MQPEKIRLEPAGVSVVEIHGIWHHFGQNYKLWCRDEIGNSVFPLTSLTCLTCRRLDMCPKHLHFPFFYLESPFEFKGTSLALWEQSVPAEVTAASLTAWTTGHLPFFYLCSAAFILIFILVVKNKLLSLPYLKLTVKVFVLLYFTTSQGEFITLYIVGL